MKNKSDVISSLVFLATVFVGVILAFNRQNSPINKLILYIGILIVLCIFHILALMGAEKNEGEISGVLYKVVEQMISTTTKIVHIVFIVSILLTI